jgi:hypothetical protein
MAEYLNKQEIVFTAWCCTALRQERLKFDEKMDAMNVPVRTGTNSADNVRWAAATRRVVTLTSLWAVVTWTVA